MQAVPQEPLTFCTGGSRSEGRGGQEEEARGRAFPWAPLPDSSYGGLFGAGGQHKPGLRAHVAPVGVKSVQGQVWVRDGRAMHWAG